MKQRIGSDLGAAIKKSCCRAVVDRCFYNDQTGCIDGCADIADFRVLQIYTTTPAQPIIAGVKWNGFDNFTGNSLSHLITPTIIIVAKSRGEIKGNPAGRIGGRDWYFAWGDNIRDGAILWDKRQVCYG